MTVPASAAPESTYELLANAARTRPDAVATQWIPDPADHVRCLAWTYAELASAVTRIANGLASLGIQREDAVTLCGPNCSGPADATRRAVAEALDRAAVSAGEITVTPGEGGLVVSVAGADTGQVYSALAGLPLIVRAAS
jgi:acyl-CoA synthetase (AMP-forming)/AMP-acid ligase II